MSERNHTIFFTGAEVDLIRQADAHLDALQREHPGAADCCEHGANVIRCEIAEMRLSLCQHFAALLRTELLMTDIQRRREMRNATLILCREILEVKL